MPMSALLNIAVAEPSAIIRSGLEAVLKRISGFRIQIIEIATAELLQETLRSDLKIDYKTGEFTFFNLKVCETVSIEKPEEIEVF